MWNHWKFLFECDACRVRRFFINTVFDKPPIGQNCTSQSCSLWQWFWHKWQEFEQITVAQTRHRRSEIWLWPFLCQFCDILCVICVIFPNGTHVGILIARSSVKYGTRNVYACKWKRTHANSHLVLPCRAGIMWTKHSLLHYVITYYNITYQCFKV